MRVGVKSRKCVAARKASLASKTQYNTARRARLKAANAAKGDLRLRPRRIILSPRPRPDNDAVFGWILTSLVHEARKGLGDEIKS